MTRDTEDVVARILADIASEEADSGGPDEGNPWHTFTTRISDVKLLLVDRQSLSDRIDGLTQALESIERLEPDTYWGTRDRYTGERPEEKALCESEVKDIARAALHQEGIRP